MSLRGLGVNMIRIRVSDEQFATSPDQRVGRHSLFTASPFGWRSNLNGLTEEWDSSS